MSEGGRVMEDYRAPGDPRATRRQQDRGVAVAGAGAQRVGRPACIFSPMAPCLARVEQ